MAARVCCTYDQKSDVDRLLNGVGVGAPDESVYRIESLDYGDLGSWFCAEGAPSSSGC